MNWGKFALSFFLVALLLSLELIAAPQAMGMGASNSSVTFRRAVVAWYDEKGKLDMNVTWVNKIIDFTNLTNNSCVCSNCSASNASANINVSVVTLYNMTEKREQLLFFGLNFYNGTFNYTMYALVYHAERSQYNFTLVTRIFTDPETGGYRVFVTGMNIAPNDEDRVVPVGDVIITADNLTLSEYYWTLGRVLMGLGRHDVTKWIWDKSAHELRHLSHLVRLKIPEYNQEKAVGIALTFDFSVGCTGCIALAGFLCTVLAEGVSGYLACTKACTPFCVGFIGAGGIGFIICMGVCGTTCNTLLRVIIGAGTYTACQIGGAYICEKAGLC
ncbi:halocin C8-like domain-containing protein [Thermococcus waiotapuensis]|uniref:Halocin C8-like domain-containing protein n=1 Tax=Thermococcus waiotapuensis TaxID=90909 RepID=A0AAE4NU05_9EURY|nr:halocin C8-like domain-containing protein [Thermococcus waiotapuensis]MDV3103084.1 halocin C8-like domain-containing protein [Thermococcus waiotapuensis]